MGWMKRREYSPDEMDWYCSTCKREGIVNIPGFGSDPERPRYVVCKDCGEESGCGWCPKCGMGGQYIENLTGHPTEWACPFCKTVYPLPAGFYAEPTMFQPIGETVELTHYKPLWDYFPSEKSRLTAKKVSTRLFWITMGTIVSFVIGVAVLIFGKFSFQGRLETIGNIVMLSSGAALILSALSNVLLGLTASVYRLQDLWKNKKYRRKFLFRSILILAALGMFIAGIASVGKDGNQFFAIGLWGSLILFLIATFIR